MSKMSTRLRKLADIRPGFVSDPLDDASMSAADLLDEAEKALAGLVDLHGDRDSDDRLVAADEQTDPEMEQAMRALARIRGEQP